MANSHCPIRTRPIAPSALPRQAASHQGKGRNSRISFGLRVDQNYASCDGSKRCGRFKSCTASTSLGWHSSSQASCRPSCHLPSRIPPPTGTSSRRHSRCSRLYRCHAELALSSHGSSSSGAQPISRTVHQADRRAHGGAVERRLLHSGSRCTATADNTWARLPDSSTTSKSVRNAGSRRSGEGLSSGGPLVSGMNSRLGCIAVCPCVFHPLAPEARCR